MFMKTGSLSILILLQLSMLIPVFSQENGAMSDSALRIQVIENADELFNGAWLVEATGYQKKDSTRIDTVIIYQGGWK